MEGERERSSPLNKQVRTISSRLFRNDGAQEIFSFPLIEPRSTVIFVQVATFFDTESLLHSPLLEKERSKATMVPKHQSHYSRTMTLAVVCKT